MINGMHALIYSKKADAVRESLGIHQPKHPVAYKPPRS
jgi:hypothetical protein